MSSQATLMALPPELRVWIFELALAPFAEHRIGIATSRHEYWYSDYKCMSLSAHETGCSCRCATGKLALALSQVSRQISAEVMPIIYSKALPRIRVHLSNSGATRDDIQSVLQNISASGLQHVRQLQVVDTVMDPMYISETRFEQKDYWKDTFGKLPKLQTLRIELELFGGRDRNSDPMSPSARLNSFIGVQHQLPQLRSIKVDIFPRQEYWSNRPWSRQLLDRIQADLVKHMKKRVVGDGIELEVVVHEHDLRQSWVRVR